MTSKEEALSQLASSDFPEYPTVHLSDDEMAQVSQVASKMKGIRTDKTRDLCDKSNHLGMSGEYAFAKYYNIDYSYVFGDGDLGFDFILYNQKVGAKGKIDVKTTKYRDGRLLVPKDDKLPADAYVLVIKSGNTFALAGGAYRSEVLDAPVKTLKIENYTLKQQDLKELPDPETLTEVEP